MKAAGFAVMHTSYPDRHGFFGYPPAWTRGSWVTSAKPAGELMVKFFGGELDASFGSKMNTTGTKKRK
jgi:hypothetical protein